MYTERDVYTLISFSWNNTDRDSLEFQYQLLHVTMFKNPDKYNESLITEMIKLLQPVLFFPRLVIRCYIVNYSGGIK